MDEQEKVEYELMTQVEQLETLKEEMEELGVSNLADIDAKLEELNRKLDELQKK